MSYSAFRVCRSSRLEIAVLAVASLALVLPGCTSSGDGDESGSEGNVFLFTSRAELAQATGANDINPRQILRTSGGFTLLFDFSSGSIVAIDMAGDAFLFTSKTELTQLTGGASVDLGAFDQIQKGTLADHVLTADSVTGDLIKLDTNGTPTLFTTRAKVMAVTMEATAKLSLPRELTTNQLVAQDLVSMDILRFDLQGNPLVFVLAAKLATASGLAEAQTAVAGWAHGPDTESLYARFQGSNNIVRIEVNGTVSRYVAATTIADRFPGLSNLGILDIEATLDSDALLLLIGEGTKGAAVALVSSNGSDVSVFASKADLVAEAGASVDISDLVIMTTGVLVAIDRGGAQILIFGEDGDPTRPVVVGRREDIEETTGTSSPLLSIGAGLSDGALVLPDAQTATLIRIE
ncbi:MAG TPA: hypothetical protein VMT52_07200 [Planctomycetota bacterium]|nr:hypothetical protein [Planctomycetota bacterium]